MTSRRKLSVVLTLIFALILRLFLSTKIYSGDLNNHVGWGQSILKYGFQGAYSRQYVGIMQPTYPPFSIYAFTTSVGLYNLANSTVVTLNKNIPIFPSKVVWLMEDQNIRPAFTKTITIISDLGIGLLLFMFVRKYRPRSYKLAIFTAFAYLFNPAVWYTSSLWGQIESFPLFFLLLSFWYLFNHKATASHLCFIAALLCKQQIIIFIPIFILASLKQFGLKKTLLGGAFQLIVLYITYLPFAPNLNPLWPFYVYINRIQTGSGSVWVTDHAFNVWIWFSHLKKIPDSTALNGVPTVYLGYLFFFTPTIFLLYRYLKTKLNPQLTLLCLSAVPMLSFLLLTKMHERYFAPALPFLILSSAFSPWLWLVSGLVSLAHLANLHHEWWYPRIDWLVTWLSTWSTIELIAIIFIISTTLVLFTTIRKSYDK